jgi:hypothetical protein
VLAVTIGMLLILAVLVGIAWLLGFVVFHVAGAAIHVLLAVAIVAAIVHFARGGASGGGSTVR